MSQGPQHWSDERLDQLLGNLLRWGVVLAAAVVAAGGAHYLVKYGAKPADFHNFQGEPKDLTQPVGILADAEALRPRGLIQLGLLLLIATPVARVAFSAFAFAFQRDWLYVVLTLCVLALLLYSLFYAGR